MYTMLKFVRPIIFLIHMHYCSLVSCINLTDPTNGMVTCSLGDDNIATDGDTCNYICDTGYVLSGNAMRTCGSIGMWDGTEPTCIGKEA